MSKRKLLKNRVLLSFVAIGLTAGTGAGVIAQAMPYTVTYAQDIPVPAKGAAAAVLGRLAPIAFTFIGKNVIEALKESSDTSDGTMSGIISFAEMMLYNNQGYTNRSLVKMCNQILNTVSAIRSDISKNQAKTTAALSKISQQISQQNINDDRKQLNNFYDKYNDLLKKYENLTEKAKVSGEAAESGRELTQQEKNDLEDAYKEVNDFYKSLTISNADGNTTLSFNFTNDLLEVLNVVSAFSPSQELSLDLNDRTGWGNKRSGTQTYLDHMYELVGNASAFEHTAYETMSSAMNETASIFSVYLMAYRYYVEYKVQLLNSDPSYTEQNRDAVIRKSWNEYYEAQRRVIRAIDQMVAEYDTVMSGWMNPYDSVQNMKMDYKSGDHHYAYKEFEFPGSDVVDKQANMYANHTSQFMKMYVVKPLNNKETSYAINTWDSGNNIVAKDITYDSGKDFIGSRCYALNQDYYNLKQTSGEDAGYSTITQSTDLSDLVSTSAYDKYQNNIVEYLKSSITDGEAGSVTLPSVESKGYSTDDKVKRTGAFALLYNRNSWTGASMDLSLFNISISYDVNNKKNSEIGMSAGDIYQGKYSATESQPLYVFMKSDAAKRTISENTENGKTQIFSVEKSTAPVSNVNVTETVTPVASGSSVASGKAMRLVVTPDSGKVLDSIEMYDADGNLLHSLVKDREHADLLVRESDGSYVVDFSSPYQNVTFKVVCSDDETPSGTVNLVQQEDGDIQFVSHNAIRQKDYNAGDTVEFSVRPYSGKLVKSVLVRDESGHDIAVNLSNEIPYMPNEQTYTFVMPKGNVTVAATFDNGNTVTFANSANGHLETDMNVVYSKWTQYSVTYKKDDVVSLKAVPEEGYYVSNITARTVNGAAPVKMTTVNDDGVTFTMPNDSVEVTAEFSKSTEPNVYLENNRYGVISFEDADGNTANSNRKPYKKGETVTLNVNADDKWKNLIGFDVYMYDGSKVDYNYDKNTNKLTFTMPDGKVNVRNNFFGGEGTAESPYIISKSEDLLNFELFCEKNESVLNGINFKITGDIDATYIQHRYTSPVFGGILDGGGHKISNLSNSLVSTLTASGTVKNIILENSNVAKSEYSGAAADINNGTIDKVMALTPSVSGTSSSSGLVVPDGVLPGPSTGQGTVGGLVGKNNGTIKNSAVRYGTFADYSAMGGLAGEQTADGSIKDSYAVSETAGEDAVVGHGASEGVVNNVFYCKDAIKDGTTSKVGTAVPMSDMSRGYVAFELNHGVTDGTQTWYQNIDRGTPQQFPEYSGNTVYGNGVYYNNYSADGFDENGNYTAAIKNQDGTYEIYNAGQLFWFASLVNGDTSHASFDGQDTGAKAVLKTDIDLGGREWTPIGKNGTDYRGIFDGNGHTISNMSIKTADTYLGLFGHTVGADIKNVTVGGKIATSFDLTDHYVGGVVGYCEGGNIFNVVSETDMDLTQNDGTKYLYAGGIAGQARTVKTIDKSANKGNIKLTVKSKSASKTKDYMVQAGGIAGSYFDYDITGNKYAGSSVTDVANYGNITSEATSSAVTDVGGIFGSCRFDTSDAHLKGSVNTGTLKGTLKQGNVQNSPYVGGIIGNLTVKDSNNKTPVSEAYWLAGSANTNKGIGHGSGSTTEVSAEQMASGDIAWKLNTYSETVENRRVWSQEGSYPVLSDEAHTPIYRVKYSYYRPNGETEDISSNYVKGGELLKLASAPEYRKKAFIGWLNEKGILINDNEVVNSDRNLYAAYKDYKNLSSSSSGVNTGDRTQSPVMWIIAGAGAAAAALMSVFIRRKKTSESEK